MSLTIDHLVILVKNLDTAITDYRALGFHVLPGGTHAEGATHNALVSFADGSYLELIAFLDHRIPHRWAAPAKQGLEGFIDYALLPGSVPEVVAAARARGLDYQGPFDGGRIRPDGERLVWQTGLPASRDLPFLCGDVTARTLRVPGGDAHMHANGTRGVATLTVLVRDLDTSLARYAALLGPQVPDSVQPFSLPGVGLRQALLPLGSATLALVSPDGDAPEGAALRLHLEQRGEGLIGLTLQSTSAQARQLPRARSHGAAIGLQAG